MNSIGRETLPQKKIAICNAGGGATGMVSVGYFKRIYELRIKPSFLFGTSAGALTVATFAMGDLDLMEWLWLNIRNRDVKRFAPWKLATPDACMFDSAPLERILRKHFDISKIIANKIPTYITRSNILTFSANHYRLDIPREDIDPVKILLASTAIPGLFPPVGQVWFDGGLTDNFNAQIAADNGATDIIMLHTSKPRPLNVRSILDIPEVLLSTMQWSNYQRELEGINTHPAKPTVKALIPSFPVPIGMFDFDIDLSVRKKLIKQGYDLAVKVLG